METFIESLIIKNDKKEILRIYKVENATDAFGLNIDTPDGHFMFKSSDIDFMIKTLESFKEK